MLFQQCTANSMNASTVGSPLKRFERIEKQRRVFEGLNFIIGLALLTIFSSHFFSALSSHPQRLSKAIIPSAASLHVIRPAFKHISLFKISSKSLRYHNTSTPQNFTTLPLHHFTTAVKLYYSHSRFPRQGK